MDVQYIDLNELSTRTGVSPRTLRKWIRDPAQPLPAYRVGGKLLFQWCSVERWLENFRVTPIDADALADELANAVKDDDRDEAKAD